MSKPCGGRIRMHTLDRRAVSTIQPRSSPQAPLVAQQYDRHILASRHALVEAWQATCLSLCAYLGKYSRIGSITGDSESCWCAHRYACNDPYGVLGRIALWLAPSAVNTPGYSTIQYRASVTFLYEPILLRCMCELYWASIPDLRVESPDINPQLRLLDYGCVAFSWSTNPVNTHAGTPADMLHISRMAWGLIG